MEQLQSARRWAYYSKFGELSPTERAERAAAAGEEPVAASDASAEGAPTLATFTAALNAVPHARFDAAVEESMQCPICFIDAQDGEMIATLETTCGHRFHRTCLLTWLMRTNECPLCRERVMPDWARSPLVRV